MFNSNKLDHLGAHLGLGRKVDTGGFETWAGCMRGDMKFWKLMTKYAKQDVDLLRKVYMKLRPWMTNHPNLNIFDGTDGCPTCGSRRLQKRGTRRTQVAIYQQYQCNNCKAYSRERLSISDHIKPEIVP
jgi:DNA-directed RNA polymerase subunit RPC12/RpoP